MKKRLTILFTGIMIICLVACGAKTEETGGLQVEEIPAETTGKITEEQATQAIHDYCIESFPDLANMEGSDDYTLYWEASTNENGEIVVLYRAYTGALIRYYVNPETGDTYVTEQVPGIIDDEQRTEETLNVKDYIK